MTASRWLRRPQDEGKIITSITPEQAGWRYLGFEVHRLAPDEVWSKPAQQGLETAVVLLEGQCTIEAQDERWEHIGRRTSVWSGLPWALYLPPGRSLRITGESSLTFAIGTAPAQGRFPPTLITPSAVEVEVRGGGNATRQINHIIKSEFPAERLLVVEVYTPAGNWSSYPPHKHDVQQPPSEVQLEEVYFYQVESAEGYALQRLYTHDGRLDEVLLCRNNDLVLVPYGYHPVVALPQSRVYYLNFLAGDVHSMAASDDPPLAWIRDTWTPQSKKIELISDGVDPRRG
ncbi:MAG: 5-deoxy-glucuronate isomerase [Chloroflexi bacterium]|nr:5-deoxy-glucuronate isomerase [Chloroflexota bacterium]